MAGSFSRPSTGGGGGSSTPQVTVVPIGTALPTDPTALAALNGTLWVEYDPSA